ncbi:MAG: beta-lactamase family protein [Acidobacteriaceae bacterium]|nr:beta-lactamase family protein [Acidobacteriaceae bacterium]MBV9782060.1 beta-lactamase family protein [Acidobacteriaceae bacterium]
MFSHKLLSNSHFRVAVALLISGLSGASQSAKQAPLVPKPQPEPKKQVTAPITAHPFEAADIQAFLDGLMPLSIERDDIAGAVISIVKDGKVVFAKGYGYADVKSKKPVSPTDTLFRPGSVSKLFTWTAVMQQVEQGKLDLDRDVNDYLDFKVPATFDKPITLRNAMTHTAGFSETAKDMWVSDPKKLTTLRTYLINHMPARIYPPGTTPAYSNYATTLAGYIVQRVSGTPFEKYITDRIFKPLDMPHSTFDQPLPPNLKPLMSKGYKTASEDAKEYEVVQPWPAGSSAVSAMDMAHFMIAHLQGGEYNGARILQPATVEQMHTRQALPAGNALNAMCLGFYEETRNGHRIFGHAGDTLYFHSDLHLMPDANLGFFVSYNSAGKGTLSNRSALWQYFLDRYFPYHTPTPPAIASADSDAKQVTGDYMVSRRLQGNFLFVASMPGEAKLEKNSDATISVAELDGFNGKPMKFREIAPKVYQNVDGQEKLAFYQGYDGRQTFGIDFPFMVFQKATFFQSKPFNYFVLFASLAILVLAVLFWPISTLVRRHYRTRLELNPNERRLRLLAYLVCLLDLAVVAGFAIVVSKSDDVTALNDSLDKWIHLLQLIGVIAVIGTLVTIYYAVVVWGAARAQAHEQEVGAAPYVIPRGRFLWSRLSATAIVLACVGFSWILLYWGILNFRLNY